LYRNNAQNKNKNKMNLKKFYTKNYSNDNYGKQINPLSTFVGLLDKLHKGHNIYDYIGISDSCIRERLFLELANILITDYDYIYKLWIDKGSLFAKQKNEYLQKQNQK
tara:strand:- start:344 stop:667 length:324 start_codon:yes stop_codon:yes gene_type:complete